MEQLRLNPHIAEVVCSLSGQPADVDDFRRPVGLCKCCPPPGRPLEVRYALDRIDFQPEQAVTHTAKGLWAHEDLLPVRGVPRGYAEDVGLTPTTRCARLDAATGVELWVKNEGVNPTGSFKDRGLAMAVALAKFSGARRLCLPTQGNAGVAAPFYSQRMGLEPCVVFMPEGYQEGIYHREARHFGAQVEFFGANIAASGKAMRERYADDLASGELVDVSTFFEPGRLEGKKTLGLEIAAHFGPHSLPDAILYPTGGGTGLVGIWKALRELSELGWVDPAQDTLPRLFAVQSEQCAPVVQSFERGLDQVEPVQSEGTVADGLDVPGAIMGHGILRALRESKGGAVAVGEDDIREAFVTLGRNGIAVGYESAATLAGLLELRRSGAIEEGAKVVLLLTASHLVALG